jgi:hypothetical protein
MTLENNIPKVDVELTIVESADNSSEWHDTMEPVFARITNTMPMRYVVCRGSIKTVMVSFDRVQEQFGSKNSIFRGRKDLWMPEELEGTERRYFHQFKEGGDSSMYSASTSRIVHRMMQVVLCD